LKSYLPSAHKTQVEFRSHFSGKKCVLWVGKCGTLLAHIQHHTAFMKWMTEGQIPPKLSATKLSEECEGIPSGRL